MAGSGACAPLPGPAPRGAAAAAVLVLGPPSSGRSALLFRAALAAAASSCSAGRVLFLAPRPLQRLPGCGPAPAPPAALQRIQFLYPASLPELLQLLASLHEEPWPWPGSSPSLVVLDSLEEYLAGCPGPHRAAHLAALLLDTAHHFSRRGGGGAEEAAGCRLMVSLRFPAREGEDEEEEEEEEQVSAVRRYFLAQCWLRPETQESGSSNGQGVQTRLVVRARLSQPGMEDQEWLLSFEPQEEMKISPLPCQESAGSKKLPATETQGILGLWCS